MAKRQAREEPVVTKRLNLEEDNIKKSFNDKIWQPEFRGALKEQIATAKPYNWGCIENLVTPELLMNVRKEIEHEIHFTNKETDIYKVNQSGDLANLSGLDWNDLGRLPNLFKLREVLYSEIYRDFISEVAQCGPLSGTKTDMSVNTYDKSCHLLIHDDVIGSRRVSFILYLPDPTKTWKEHYGGSLKLFDSIIPNIPCSDEYNKFIPQFNSIAFFKVQPGFSFHEVEEVKVDKHRLSIQGWYHIPQKGEKGFTPGEEEEWVKTNTSTLAQLENNTLKDYEFPKLIDREFLKNNALQTQAQVDDDFFTSEEVASLKEFISDDYLNPVKFRQLNQQFLETSKLEIGDFLNDSVVDTLKKRLRLYELNTECPYYYNDVQHPWKSAFPTHKWRYLYIDGKPDFRIAKGDDGKTLKKIERALPIDFNKVLKDLDNLSLNEQENAQTATANNVQADEQVINDLVKIANFLKSSLFKKFINKLTSLKPISEKVLIRRFRPGKDYTLATTTPSSEDPQVLETPNYLENCLLEGTLCLTPSDEKSWNNGEVGGYQLYMLNQTDDDIEGQQDIEDAAVYKNDDTGDSVLINKTPSWNTLTLVLRDENVLEFIKYVSYNAKGSRWDISMSWDVAGEDDEDNDEEN